jgi:hypothetical protein
LITRQLSSKFGILLDKNDLITLLKVSTHVNLKAANGIIVAYSINDDKSFERVE